MLSDRINMGTTERVLSGVVGGALLLLGAYLTARAATGRCVVYDALDIASVGGGMPRKRPDLHARGHIRFDVIDETVDMTFPASDPPARGGVA